MSKLLMFVVLAGHAVGQKHTSHWIVNGGHCQIQGSCVVPPANAFGQRCSFTSFLEPGWAVRGFNTTSPQLVENPPHYYWMAAPAGRTTPEWKYCLLESCALATCDAGHLLRTDAAEIVPVNQSDCCEASCGQFPCPSGFTLRADANTTVAHGEGTCCERLCSSFHCPAAFEPIFNAHLVKGDRVSQCCRKLPECQMNSNYKPVDMAGTKPRKVDSAAQCFELCERTPLCSGFSWFRDRSCHLADANASLQFSAHSASGNRSCYAKLAPRAPEKKAATKGQLSRSYCQRQPKRCSGRSFETVGPRVWNDYKSSVTRGVEVVDWDGDGFLDIVTVPSLISEEDWAGLDASLDLHIQLHNDPLPKGHITLDDSMDTVDRPQLSIFDWDSDGKLDLLLGMGSGRLRFFKGVDPPAGQVRDFQPAEEPHPFTSIRGNNNSAPAMAWWNEDEYPDLVLAHACQVDIFLGSADGSLHLAYSHYFDGGACSLVPTVWDWDSDGKPELIVGDEQGKLHLCKSMISRRPSRERLQCSKEEFKILGVGSDASPAACDWDKDGVPDLMVYGRSELLVEPHWFRRNESGVALMNPAHPLDGFDLGANAVPTLVDWDLDGDLDLIVGSDDGRVWYFPWHNGSFHSMNGWDGPFVQIDVGSKAAPATVDWDLDGYPDLVVGNGKGSLAFFRGGPGKIYPAGVEENPFYFIQTGLQVAPAFADMDGDDDFDLVFSSGQFDNAGTFYFANHNGELVPEPSPIQHVDLSPLAGYVQVPTCLQLVDFDGDGDLDLLTGSSYDATAWFLEQFEDGTFYHAQGASNPFAAGMIGLSPCPALGDIEFDGVGDLVVGDGQGMLLMFQHQPMQHLGLGTKMEDSQHHPLGSLNQHLWGGFPRKPTAVDWNGDGLLDLIVVTDTISLFLQETDGTFLPENTAPFNMILKNIPGHYPGTLRSVDWDFDGDMDLVLFCVSGVFFFERMGEELAAPKQLVFNSTTVPEGVNLGSVFSGDIVDWDGDGDWDLILCPTFPVILLALQEDNEFRIVPDADSPFRAVQFGGGEAVVTIADLDADGYLDMLVGTAVGKISVFRQDSSHAFVHQEEFDVHFPLGGPTGPVFGDWDGDGDLEVLVGTANKWEYFKFGACQLQDPCFVNAGFCRSGACQCLGGHDGKDCSKCLPGFATVQRSSKTGHTCTFCPGVRSEAGPCNGKGRCFDDQLSADILRQQGLTAIQPLGNGSCSCNRPFLGADCNEGECPSGTELSRELDGTLRCTLCLPGYGKEAAGNRRCQACEPGMFSNGSGFCQPCEAGMRQASYGQAACEFCPPGFAPRDDAKYCSYCSRGTYAAAGDASCRPCEPGSYQRDTGQTFCEVCPAGFTTDEDRTACNRCQAGTFSKDSLTGCQTCGGFTAPNEQQTNCIPSWAKLAGAVVFTFFAAFFMWLLPFFVGIKRHIADVSWLPTDEAVILTTRQKHQFSSKYIPVVFRDTGVSWLQESTESTTEDGKTKSAPTISSSSSSSSSTSTSSIMYVKKTSPTQLQIYTEPGCPLAKRAETSIGTFRPTPLAEAFGSVFLGIPVVLWMGVSIAGMIAMALLIHIPWWYYIATFVFDFFVVLALRLLQRRHDAATPLQALLDSYKAKVMTNPTPCGPGPLRSVNVGKLCKFEEHFRPILQRRSMYYVCPNLVKPLTKEKEVSFAEFVGCDLVDWFISHFWGLPFCDFILSLQQHAKHHAENWEDVRYWICTFSNNQWKMDEEIPRDAPPTESSFFKALTSPTCLGTGMMMDVDVTPLKRSWCLFEMLHTFRQRDHTQERPIAFQGLLMLTPQGVLNTGRGSLDTALRIGQRLTTLKLEEATAAEIADKEKIDAEVRAQEGGFPAINAKLRSEICQVLEQMASTFTEDLSELARQLRERELSPTCNETSPLEVHVADDDPVRPKPWQQRPSAAFGAELTKWAKFRTSEGSGEDP